MNGSILNYLRSDAAIQSNKTALVHQMAQGMEYLHSRDILHGDFKVGPIQSAVCRSDSFF
jgi:serine/threonine protein kinase